MRYNKKSVVLFIFTTILTLYTITVHIIADRHLYEDPITKIVYWTSGPSGSLFPWPKAPGLLEILTKVNEVDLFVYKYLINTWVLVVLSIIMWIITGLFIFRMINSNEQSKKDEKFTPLMESLNKESLTESLKLHSKPIY